jgi:hypothetical protein
LDLKIDISILKIEIEIMKIANWIWKLIIEFEKILLFKFRTWYLNSENWYQNLKIIAHFDFKKFKEQFLEWNCQVSNSNIFFQIQIKFLEFK